MSDPGLGTQVELPQILGSDMEFKVFMVIEQRKSQLRAFIKYMGGSIW